MQHETSNINLNCVDTFKTCLPTQQRHTEPTELKSKKKQNSTHVLSTPRVFIKNFLQQIYCC